MFKKLLLTSASAATFALAACGGGGGAGLTDGGNNNGGNNNGGGNTTPTQYRVAGPLDAVQAPVSSQVFGQLESATDGTPLQALLVCADSAINFDALDIADTIANALQAAAAAGSPNPAAIAATAASLNSSVMQLANDVQGLLNSLAGSGGCNTTTGKPVGIGLGAGNPLAGTPLASLGLELQGVLATVALQHPGSAGSVLSLGNLAGITSQLSTQIDTGLAGVNAVAPAFLTRPVAGGIVASMQTMLHDVDALMQAAATTDTDAVKAAINTLLAHVMTNSLTQAVPLNLIEAQASQAGLFSNPVTSGSANIANLFTSSLGTVYTTNALKTALTGQLTPMLDPIVSQVLPVISDQFVLSLHNLSPNTLGNALVELTTLLGPVGGIGQPVTSLLTQIVGAVQSGAGGIGVCPSTNPLLNVLCGLLP